MRIIPREQAIQITKPDGTRVAYSLFSEYEIHYSELPAGAVQPWHHHQHIEEAIYVIAGELEARWLRDGVVASETLRPGDIARVERTPHTFANTSGALATFLVVRLILTGTDQRERIMTDKQLDTIE